MANHASTGTGSSSTTASFAPSSNIILATFSSILRTFILCGRPSNWLHQAEKLTSSPPSPLASSSWLSRLWFAWASGLVAIGYDRPVQMKDLWKLRPWESADDSYNALSKLWNEEIKNNPTNPNFTKITWKFVRWQLFLVFLCKMGWLLFAMVGNAYLLRELVIFFYTQDRPLWHGLLLALGFIITEFGRSLCVNHHWLIAVLIGIRLRAGVRGLLYNKTLQLRATAVNTGQAVSLLSNDASRLLEACNYAEFMASTPVTVIVALGVMIWVIGISALAGFAILLIFSPLQAKIGRWLATLRRETAKVTDERVRVMSELLSGMRLTKLYGYEGAFAEKVAGIRDREVSFLRRAAVVRTINTVAAFSLPVIVTLATFAVNALIGNSLDPAAAFVCLALFNVARFPLGVLPQSTRCVSEAVVACKRIQNFLLLPEVRTEDEPIRLPYNIPNKENEDTEFIQMIEKAKQRIELFSNTPNQATDEKQQPQQETTILEKQLPANNTVVEIRHASFSWASITLDSKPVQGDNKGANKNSSNDKKEGAHVVVNVLANKPSEAPSTSSPAFKLADVRISITKGQLIGVVGSVGSGKSSLLSALLGLMTRENGLVFIRGKIAYAAQVPWIFSGTLRENILFGQAYDEKRYNEIIKACALLPDLAILPAGDLTEIGERGLNLSGGQKARVSLARAAYADADIYLLDDPLSAVDAHVGKHLWHKLIEKTLIRQGKTVIVVTHQLHFLPYCSSVAVLAGGKITAFGKYTDLRKSNIDLRNGNQLSPDSTDSSATLPEESTLNDDDFETKSVESEEGTKESTKSDNQKDTNVTSSTSSIDGPNKEKHLQIRTPMAPTNPNVGKLIVAEDRAIGAVGKETFKVYFIAAGGVYTAVIIFLVLLIGKGSRQVSDWFLSLWIQGGRMGPIQPLFGNHGVLTKEDQLNYAGVYAATVLAVMLSNLAQGLIFAWISLAASQRLHDRIFASVMRATVGWFDTQPTGRLLSRFTGDLDTIDQALPPTLETCLEFVTQCALSVVLIAAIFPWFIVAVVPLFALFIFITRMFRRVARELKRLDNISRGPLVSHITATAAGIATIRAYGETERFAKENDVHVDLSTRTYWCLYALNRWVAIRVDVITTLTAGITALLCVMSRDTLPPALAGLSISYALSLAGVLQYCMRLTTETEAHFTSVERLNYYSTSIPHEADTVGPALTDNEVQEVLRGIKAKYDNDDSVLMTNNAVIVHKSVSKSSYVGYSGWYSQNWNQVLVHEQWPKYGEVKCENLSIRYRDGLPLILRQVNFTIQPGHTVGVVGRTGSGKTTLTLALFRIIEAAEGRILLDGIDISKVSVHHLRRRLAIIPQDPTLFRGTLRSNLDLFNEHTDEALWEALQSAGLDNFVKNLQQGLTYPVDEGGSNLSVGQRQLLCLARALLRKARIIVMDEATASLDAASDAHIQAALRTSMKGCTVIIVAHRLHTVMDCHRVLSLRDGNVEEYDAPAALLGLVPSVEVKRETTNSILLSLVEETGLETSNELKHMALEAYNTHKNI